MVDIFKRCLSGNTEFSHKWFPLKRSHIIQNSLNLIGIQVQSLYLQHRNPSLYVIISLLDVLFRSLHQQLGLNLKCMTLVINEPPMIEDGDTVGFFNEIDMAVSWPNKPFEEYRRDAHNSFCNAHLSLQLFDYLLGNIDNQLEHLYLLAGTHN